MARPTRGAGRTTHLPWPPTQDDIEIMAYHGILECFESADRGFLGGHRHRRGREPADGIYANTPTTRCRRSAGRAEEGRRGGRVLRVALLDYPSPAVKDPRRKWWRTSRHPRRRQPSESSIPTTSPTSTTPTWRSALRAMRPSGSCRGGRGPEAVYGCEVWRDLDWLPSRDKVAFDVGDRENLAAALVGVFDSQITGGKRYDLATPGRRRAHATYHESHGRDVATGLTFAMDLTPLIQDPGSTLSDSCWTTSAASRRTSPRSSGSSAD